MNITADGIIEFLEDIDYFYFPLLNSIDTYLAGIQLRGFASESEWLIVYDWLRYEERSSAFERAVWAFGNHLKNQGPQSASQPVTTLDKGSLYREPDECFLDQWEFEVLVNGDVTKFKLSPSDYLDAGIDVDDGLPVAAHIIRYLHHRLGDALFAQSERELLAACSREDSGLEQILHLKEYFHMHALEECIDEDETYLQLAEALASRDASRYNPTRAPNNAWQNTPKPFD